jgi:hypothetical protein
MHHHVALHDALDVRRLYRFLSGCAIGFVAGGGGALGSAHLGVYKAFREAGAEFDILGGTSVGAAMMAALAYGVDPERVDEGTHNIFVKSRAFRRPSRICGYRSSRFPAVSVCTSRASIGAVWFGMPCARRARYPACCRRSSPRKARCSWTVG